MIRSMTGFGRAEYSDNGSIVTAEIHSVNGRFFDVRMKLPKTLYEYEAVLRKVSQEYVKRGKVFLTVNVNRSNGCGESVQFDVDFADKYMGLSREIASRYSIENNIDARTLMALPDVIVSSEEECEDGVIWEMAQKAVRSAFEIHTAMREEEGAVIGSDIEARLESVGSYLDQIELRIPVIVETNKERYRKRIENLVGAETVDEVRFAMEVAIYADRIDITEECVRFKSHNEQFAREIKNKITSGKKLLFLLQEMNREANTIGSKIMDADSAQIVVQIKEELEKMREQAENME